MHTPKRWIVVGTAALLGVGGGGSAALASTLNDRSDAAVDLSAVTVAQVDDGSPESADSPAESPAESAESATDSPDDPGYVDPSPESTDSPAESPADSPAPAPPAPAPAPVGHHDGSPGSADSPVDRGGSDDDSPESADSPDDDD